MKATFPYRYRVAFLLFFLIVVTYLDRVTISLVGVRIKNEFGLTNEQFGWALGAFALAYALFEIPTAVLGDRIGQRNVFIRIVLWWSLFTVLTGAVTGLSTLLAVRFLFGMGEAGALPNSSGVIARWFPASETAKATSTLMLGSFVGAAIAPLIVVPLAATYGWRMPFFVNGAIGLVWVVICLLWFRNNPADMKNISEREKNVIEQQRRFSDHQQPFPWKKATASANLWALVLAYYGLQWANYFFIAWMPVYLQQGRHFSETKMKATMSYVFLVAIASALVAGIVNDWLVKKKGLTFGRRIVAVACFVCMGTLLFLSATSASTAVVIICLIAANFFNSPCAIASFSTCVDIGGDHAGTVAGIMNSVGQLGAFFMAVLFGKIVDATHSFATPLFILSGVSWVGALLWFFVDANKPLIIKPEA